MMFVGGNRWDRTAWGRKEGVAKAVKEPTWDTSRLASRVFFTFAGARSVACLTTMQYILLQGRGSVRRPYGEVGEDARDHNEENVEQRAAAAAAEGPVEGVDASMHRPGQGQAQGETWSWGETLNACCDGAAESTDG